jgi:hypothetical protein
MRLALTLWPIPAKCTQATLLDNIKKDLTEIGWGGMDWTDLAKGRDQWRALVNTVMNLRVPETAAQLAASQEGLSSVELGVGNSGYRPVV